VNHKKRDILFLTIILYIFEVVQKHNLGVVDNVTYLFLQI